MKLASVVSVWISQTGPTEFGKICCQKTVVSINDVYLQAIIGRRELQTETDKYQCITNNANVNNLTTGWT